MEAIAPPWSTMTPPAKPMPTPWKHRDDTIEAHADTMEAP
jgi:hypothetical protein